MIEPDHEGAFLSEHPVILLKTGQTANVPWLKGITSYDGLTFAVSLVTENYLVGDLNDRFDVLAPIALMLIELTRNITDVTDQIRKFYFGNEAITMDKRIDIVNVSNSFINFKKMLRFFLQLFTDRFFLNGAVLSNLLQLKQTNASPIYYYLFDYKGTVTNAVLFGDNYPYGKKNLFEATKLISAVYCRWSLSLRRFTLFISFGRTRVSNSYYFGKR